MAGVDSVLGLFVLHEVVFVFLPDFSIFLEERLETMIATLKLTGMCKTTLQHIFILAPQADGMG